MSNKPKIVGFLLIFYKMNHIFIISLITLIVVSGMSAAYAQPDQYEKVIHYGVSKADFSDRLDFTYYDNTLTGFVLYDGEQTDFSLSVKFTSKRFVASNNNILIKGFDLSEPHNMLVKLNGEKTILFQMTMPKEPIFVNKILPPLYRFDPEIVFDKIPNDILENYKQYKARSTLNENGDTEKIGISIHFEEKDIRFSEMDKIFKFNLAIKNVTNHDPISNANVTVVFNRDGHELITQNYVSDDDGTLEVKVATLHPVFYPLQCVNMNMTAQYNDFTAHEHEDFKITDSPNNSYLESLDMTWINESIWSHLPEEFKLLDREIEDYDYKCNK